MPYRRLRFVVLLLAALTLVIPPASPPAPRKASIKGIISPLAPVDSFVPVFHILPPLLDFEDPPAYGSTTASFTPSTYQADYQWCGRDRLQGELHVLQLRGDSTSHPQYAAYGMASGFTLTDGVTRSGPVIALAPVTGTSTLEGFVVVPSGMVVSRKTLDVAFPAYCLCDEGMPVSTLSGSEEAAAPAFSFTTPKIPGARANLTIEAVPVSGGGSSVITTRWIPLDTTGMRLRLLPTPELIAPSDGASGIHLDEQQFTWTGSGLLLHDVVIGDSTLQIEIITYGTSVRMPDLGALGLTPFAPGATLTWSVRTSDEFPFPDDLAGRFVWGLDSYSTSAVARFTTATP